MTFSDARGRHRWRRWLTPSLGLVRLGVYLALVFAGAAALASRLLYERVKDAALAAGGQLSRLGDTTADGETVVVNGARFHRSSAYTDEGVDVVLGRIEASCARTPNALVSALDDLPSEASEVARRALVSGVTRLGIVRQGSQGRGMVACFVGDPHRGSTNFKRVLTQIVEAGSFSALGDARYVYAAPAGPGRTRVVSFGATGDLDVGRMFPGSGDAPGSDSTALPRPPRARRLLTASADGQPYAVRLYVSGAALTELQAFYDEGLANRGWRVTAGAHDQDGGTAYLRADGSLGLVTLGRRDAGTYVSLLETGPTEAPAGVQGEGELSAW